LPVYLNQLFAPYGLECVPVDYTFSPFAVYEQEEVLEGVSIETFRNRLKSGKNKAASEAFETRLRGIRDEVNRQREVLRDFSKVRFGGMFKKGNPKVEEVEELAVDFGMVNTQDDPLDNCRVVQVVREGKLFPLIRCFDL
jgi:hypothetical protein